MTRKDYVIISNALYAARRDAKPDAKSAVDNAAYLIMLSLQADNARFKRVKFLDACNYNGICDQ